MKADQECISTGTSEQGQNSLGSASAVTAAMSDPEPENDVSTKGELIFQSLFEAKETPPGSPGSATSSSTLVGPQSRKVSPTAVKDFAYTPSDNNHVLDPVAVIEGNTKKQLLKQLQKKTAAEEKASRKAVKLSARNKTLRAQLESAKANQQGDSQAHLAITHANAMTVSNVVLRQVVQDLSNELSREKNVAGIQGSESQGEVGFFEKYGIDPAVLSGTVNPVTPVVQKNSEKKNTQGVSHTEEALDQVKEHEAGSFAEETDLATLKDSQHLELQKDEDSCTDDEAEEEQAEEKQVRSGGCPAEKTQTADQVEEAQIGDDISPADEAKEQVESNVEWIFPGLKPKESGVGKGQAMADSIATVPEDALPDQDGISESSGEDQEFEVDDDNSPPTFEEPASMSDGDENTAAQEPTTESHDDIQDVGNCDEIFVNQNFEFSEPAGPATLWSILKPTQCENEAECEAVAGEGAAEISEVPSPAILQSNEDENEVEDQALADEETAAAEPTTDPMPNHDHDQEVGSSQEYFVNQNFEFAEPAGPANLWGILNSDQVEDRAVAGGEAASEEATDEKVAVEEATGAEPASDPMPSHDHDHNVSSSQEHFVNQNFEFAEPEGPANLWGILESDHMEGRAVAGGEAAGEEAAVEDTAGEEAAGESEAEVPESEVSGAEVSEAEVPEAEIPGPANLWGILESDHKSSDHDLGDEEAGEQAQVEGNTVPDASESNGVAGVQDQEDEELVDLPRDGYSPDFHGDVNELYDVSDAEEESLESTTIMTPPDTEGTAPSPCGSIKGDISDNVTVQEVGIQEVAVEVTVDAIGPGASEISVEAVTEPIGGLKVVEEEDHETANDAAEAVEPQEPVETVDRNTPIAVIDDVLETASGDATLAEGSADGDEKAAQEANASEVHVVSEELNNKCDKGKAKLGENDAIAGAGPFRLSSAGPQEGEKTGGPVVFGNLGVTYEDFNDDEDYELHDVAFGGPSTSAAECSHPTSGVVHAQLATPPSPSLAPPSYHVETFDFIPQMLQPKELTKNQKRKLERMRAAAKKKDEAAEKRRMEEEAAKTPEALAQRQAEADAKLGERRLKLQTARMQEDLEMMEKVPGAK